MTTESEQNDADGEILKPFDSVNASMEWWVTFTASPNNSIAFRYGPYTGPEVGQIMTQAVDEGIALMITGVGGKEFDWELARMSAPRYVKEETTES